MDTLYTQTNIKQIISVDFNDIENDMYNYFMNYAKVNIEGRCRKEGYIRQKSTRIDNYTAPILKGSLCIYEVNYVSDVCDPLIDNVYQCKILKLAKIGIRAVISYTNNPIIFYISREHNPLVNFDNYKEGDIINAKIIGKRFQLNDFNIEAIAEVV